MTTDPPRPPNPHRVVIVGAGFGGLEATYRLAGAPVEITLVDRRNHHLFQPLLYQVATASLATSEIAWPIRYLLRDRAEVTTLFATVSGVDAASKRVLLDDGDALPYDTLVLATGARHAYFGHDEWEPFAPGLKTLEDATTLRRRILVAFERAERENDPARRAALLTFVIVGAGPTGVELAGTIAELARDTLRPDFRNIDTQQGARGADRGRPARARGLSRRSLGLRAALAGKSRRRGDAGTGRHRMLGRRRHVWRQEPAGQNPDLGRRRARLAGRRMARRAGRPRRPPAGQSRSHRAGPSRYFCDRRHGRDRRPRRQAGPRHCAGREAAGPLCRQLDQGAAARRERCRRSITGMPAAWRRSASARR